MIEEPKGPPKINVDDILSEAGPSEEQPSVVEDLEVVGMEPSRGRTGPGGATEIPDSELAELEGRILRLRADFDNYRKRVEREKAEFSKQAAADLLHSLLPVLDNLERALAEESDNDDGAFRHGVELIYRQALDVLRRAGLEPIESVGAPFDPSCHEAVERLTTDEHPDHTVIEELLRGYSFHGRLLRAAMVRVSRRPEGETVDGPAEG